MKSVQLDKNSGAKSFCKRCNEQGLVRCYLLPENVRDKDDADVARFAIQHENLTLTFDRTFCVSAAAELAGRNPGLLLLREDDDSIRQMNTKTAPTVLRHFKQAFPDWYQVPWKNSFVELTPTRIHVYRTLTHPPVEVGCLERNQDGWQTMLRQLLEDNERAMQLGADSQREP
jgi:hypothetical protein